MPLAAMLAAWASIAASMWGTFRAFFGDFFSLLSGIKISVPFAGPLSGCLADMVDLLLLPGYRAHLAPAPLPVGETGGSKRQGDRAEGARPPFRAARRAGLHKRVPTVGEEGRRKAWKTRETARSAPASAGASPWRARGAEPHSLST